VCLKNWSQVSEGKQNASSDSFEFVRFIEQEVFSRSEELCSDILVVEQIDFASYIRGVLFKSCLKYLLHFIPGIV